MIRCSVLFAVVVTILIPELEATVLLPAEFREVVAGSEIVAHVRVSEVRPEWAEGRRRIDSIVTAEVLTPLKGKPGETLSFKVPGGELGRYRSVMVGAPRFKPGDEAVLFLTSGDGASLEVFGLNQGVFRVRRELRSGRRVVVPPALMAAADAPQQVARGSATRQPVALDAFRAQVRAALGEGSVR